MEVCVCQSIVHYYMTADSWTDQENFVRECADPEGGGAGGQEPSEKSHIYEGQPKMNES